MSKPDPVPSVPAPSQRKGIASRGSRVALEAAGWRFTPTHGARRHAVGGGRYQRGTLLPPAGCGIAPREFYGNSHAIAWAVEQSARMAEMLPGSAMAGMCGIRMFLNLALASGEVCTAEDEVPTRPDAELLSVCADLMQACRSKDRVLALHLHGSDPRFKAFTSTFTAIEKTAPHLAGLHATSREGLLRKARAVLAAFDQSMITRPVELDIARSLIVDLIHLVPTLVEDRRPKSRPSSAAGDV